MQAGRGLVVSGDRGEQAGPRPISDWEIAEPLIRRLGTDEEKILALMVRHNAERCDCLPGGEAHVAQCEEWARLCESLRDNERRRTILLVRLGLLNRLALCR